MIHLNFHQNWWHRKKQNWKELLSPELVIFSSLKKSPISSNHQNFHQNWWHKKPNIGRNYCHQNWWHFCHSRNHQLLQFTKIFTKIGDKKKLKIGRNYCHQNWWHFRHSKTHQFLQFTKIFTKIGEKLGENSVENSIHQNVHQNWWKFWRKCTRKWVPYPTSTCGKLIIPHKWNKCPSLVKDTGSTLYTTKFKTYIPQYKVSLNKIFLPKY